MCMQAGRWKSNRMPLRYGENVLAARGGIAPGDRDAGARCRREVKIMETGNRGQIHDRDCAVSGAVGDSPQRLSAVMLIPPRVHFCWIGPQLSWAYAFALLSAAAQADMDEEVDSHSDELEEGAR